MSYESIHRCAYDEAFLARVEACIAQEQGGAGTGSTGEAVSPAALLEPMRWAVATAGDVEAAYESAIAAGNPNPGGDPAVVTDGMILASVQASWPSSAP